MPTFNEVFATVPQGWLTEGEARLLWDAATLATRVLEIGCYYGRSACVLAGALSHRPDTVLYLVDPFGKQPDGHHFGTSPEEIVRAEKAVVSTRNAVLRWLPKDRFTIFEMTEQAMFESGVIKSLNMAYVDGEHSYEGTKGAIDRCLSVMGPSTTMLLHDYCNDGGGREIVRAVNDTPRLKLRLHVGRMAVCEVL